MHHFPRIKRVGVIALMITTLLGISSKAFALGSPQLLKDINLADDGVNLFGQSEDNFAVTGDYFYFASDMGGHGYELWRSDGTVEGSELVKDIYPGEQSSWPFGFFVFDNELYFNAYTGDDSVLYKTNGTSEGTVPVKTLYPGAYGYAEKYFEFKGELYFLAINDDSRNELWKTDGTTEGTEIVYGTPENDSYQDLNILDAGTDHFYLTLEESDGELETVQILVGDGTSILPITDQAEEDINGEYEALGAIVGDNLVFRHIVEVEGNSEEELWIYDPVLGYASRLVDMTAGDESTEFRSDFFKISPNRVVFTACTDGEGGDCDPWVTDGTAMGTKRLADFVEDESSSVVLVNTDGTTGFFIAYILGAQEGGGIQKAIWKTDGTPEGSSIIYTYSSEEADESDNEYFDNSETIIFGGELYVGFCELEEGIGCELYKTDGTSFGLVKDMMPDGSSYPTLFFAFKGELYFVANTLEHGREIYTTDGTEEGTHIALNFDSDTYGSGGEGGVAHAAIGNLIYFTPRTLTPGGLKYVTWVTDVTTEGTRPLIDLESEDIPEYGSYYTEYNGMAYFSAYTDSYGAELWKSGGTEETTEMVIDLAPGDDNSGPYSLVVMDDTLYFVAYVEGAPHLFKTDGTEEGTALVSDEDFSYIGNITVHEGALYFSATDDLHGNELWKTDGTDAGTVLVKDIEEGYGDASVSHLASANGALYFSAATNESGSELWKSDGTSGGTMMVRDIYAGAEGSSPTDITVVRDTLFFVAHDEENGRELWKSNGTEAGTVMVKNINPESDSYPNSLTKHKGTLFFAASSPDYGVELWKSDGTEAGTVMVKNINDDDYGSSPSNLTSIGDLLFFSANTVQYGWEPWVSDGTEEGTYLLDDINEGDESSEGSNFTLLGNKLFFYASDPEHGNEPHYVTGITVSEEDPGDDPEGEGPPTNNRGGGGRVIGGYTNPRPVTSPVASPSSTVPVFNRDLQTGSSGNDVLTLQRFLNGHGYIIAPAGPGSPGNETSIFGALTQAALARFQAANGIVPAAGYFGPITRAFINAMLGGTQPNTVQSDTTVTSTPRDLELGMSGDDVRALQQYLISKDYSIPAGATGFFGEQTLAALIAFQMAGGINPAAGYYGAITRAYVAMHP